MARINLSSANWASNKPNLDQSLFDTLNISGTKFFVDELRIGTTFIDVVSGIGPKDPSPYDGETVESSSDLLLSWTNVDPNRPADSVYVDVWFGTDPNKLGSDYTKIVVALADVSSVTVDASVDGTYYWQVDSYIYGDPDVVGYDINGTDPNFYPIIEGPVWKFFVVSDVPPDSVVIDTLDMITWSGEPVGPLAATVFGDDGVSALTYTWTSDPADGVVFLPNANDPAPTVTITAGHRVVRGIQVENDDAEQYLNTEEFNGGWGGVWAQGNLDLTSTDLEVGDDGEGGKFWQVVAVQYAQLGIPQGATITSP